MYACAGHSGVCSLLPPAARLVTQGPAQGVNLNPDLLSRFLAERQGKDCECTRVVSQEISVSANPLSHLFPLLSPFSCLVPALFLPLQSPDSLKSLLQTNYPPFLSLLQPLFCLSSEAGLMDASDKGHRYLQMDCCSCL